jgi:hypothetical protein
MARQKPLLLISGPFKNTGNLPRSSFREIYSSVANPGGKKRIKMYYWFVRVIWRCGSGQIMKGPSKTVQDGASM